MMKFELNQWQKCATRDANSEQSTVWDLKQRATRQHIADDHTSINCGREKSGSLPRQLAFKPKGLAHGPRLKPLQHRKVDLQSGAWAR